MQASTMRDQKEAHEANAETWVHLKSDRLPLWRLHDDLHDASLQHHSSADVTLQASPQLEPKRLWR